MGTRPISTVTEIPWSDLGPAAWQARANARVHGPTRVGAAVLSSDGQIFSGCNVEHQFRSHDVHAEVNALSSMVAAGSQGAVALLIAAERERFTPCGSCVDWIFELGGKDCLVGFQASEGGEVSMHLAHELMPYYPT